MDRKNLDFKTMEILEALAVLEIEGQGAFQDEIASIQEKLNHI